MYVRRWKQHRLSCGKTIRMVDWQKMKKVNAQRRKRFGWGSPAHIAYASKKNYPVPGFWVAQCAPEKGSDMLEKHVLFNTAEVDTISCCA